MNLDLVFPMNVVETVMERFTEVLGEDYTIVDRQLRTVDPSQSVGIFAVDWRPGGERAYEIGGQIDPTLSTYLYRIQNSVQHSDESEGRSLYSMDSKKVRALLYRDQELHVRLRALNETVLGHKERVQRFGIRTQRFLNNELNGTFLYIATTEFWVETETVPA